MFCYKCGAKNPDDAVFCFKCGADLSKITPQPNVGGRTITDNAIPDSSTNNLMYNIDNAETIVDSSISIFKTGYLLNNRYQITKQIGHGGMGIVYRAYDNELKQDVAIKLLPDTIAHNEKALELMKREAKISLMLSHPNIVRLNNFEQTDNKAYLIMEYIEGESLSDILLEKGKLSVDEALGISKQILEALSYAHEQKVVHRDLKPGNIIITTNPTLKKGEKGGFDTGFKVKVLDFGIARVIKETMTKLTGTTATSGTLLYMAPEQLKSSEQDNRVDIWAYGIVMYEMLTGHTPFMDSTMVLQVAADPIPNIPEWLNSIILKCLEKDKNNRFLTIEDIINSIEQKTVVTKPLPTATRPSSVSSIESSAKNDHPIASTESNNVYKPQQKIEAKNNNVLLPIIIIMVIVVFIVGVLIYNNHQEEEQKIAQLQAALQQQQESAVQLQQQLQQQLNKRSTAQLYVYLCPDVFQGCSSKYFLLTNQDTNAKMFSPLHNAHSGRCYNTHLLVSSGTTYELRMCTSLTDCSKPSIFTTPQGFEQPTYYDNNNIGWYCNTPCSGPSQCP
jgi:serine/threonine protein kinase